MKALLFLLCAVFFSGSALASPGHCGIQSKDPDCPPGYRDSKGNTVTGTAPGSARVVRRDDIFTFNKHVEQYAPPDISSKQGTYRYGGCTVSGQYAEDRALTRRCQDFYSASQGNWWRIRFGNAGNAEYIFKLNGENPELWVKFKPGTQHPEYVSNGARQYAATNGGNQNAEGYAPQPQAAQGGACDHLSGNALTACNAASAIGPALGGLLKW